MHRSHSELERPRRWIWGQALTIHMESRSVHHRSTFLAQRADHRAFKKPKHAIRTFIKARPITPHLGSGRYAPTSPFTARRASRTPRLARTLSRSRGRLILNLLRRTLTRYCNFLT